MLDKNSSMRNYILLISQRELREFKYLEDNVLGLEIHYRKQWHMTEFIQEYTCSACALLVFDLVELNVKPTKIVQYLRYMHTIPIVIVSDCAKVSLEERIQVLQAGADAYIPQFSDQELKINVEVLGRRYLILDRVSGNRFNNYIYGEGFFLDLKERRAFFNGQEKFLTKIEFDIVYYLAASSNRAVTYEELYEAVWHEEYLRDDMNIMAHIHRIRSKLEENPNKPVFIQNVYGIGYRFCG